MGGYNLSYLLLVVPAVLLSLAAQVWVKTAYERYSRVATAAGVTGADAARDILDTNGASQVEICVVDGELTDHYNPASNTIALSGEVYSGNSVSAIGIAAHEAGHAVQYSTGYLPIRLRALLIPVTNIGSAVSWPLILLGLLLSIGFLVNVGIALFSLAVVFQLLTLPVEFNASRRAVRALENSGNFSDEELAGSKKVLTAAALTYVAALLVSVMNLLRLVSLFGRRR